MEFHKLLDKFQLTEENLNSEERQTLERWIDAARSKEISLDDVRANIGQLITAVERELATLRESTSFWNWLFHHKRDTYLKARLFNYLMLQDFLLSPERAKKFIEQNLSNLANK